jgi:hypothetical protein
MAVAVAQMLFKQWVGKFQTDWFLWASRTLVSSSRRFVRAVCMRLLKRESKSELRLIEVDSSNPDV